MKVAGKAYDQTHRIRQNEIESERERERIVINSTLGRKRLKKKICIICLYKKEKCSYSFY